MLYGRLEPIPEKSRSNLHHYSGIRIIFIARRTRLRARFHFSQRSNPGKILMLYTIVVVLVVLWLLGLVTHVAGGLIHLLLVVAVIILIFNLISGRRGL
jgi:hypothetical protein